MDDTSLLEFVKQKLPSITELHNGQGDVMRKLLNGISCLAVIPTGGGKSLLWLLFISIAATKRAGSRPLCIVLVPYKSLILNHKEATKQWFLDSEVVTSEDDDSYITENIDRASVVYMTPEKYMRSAKFRSAITNQCSRTYLVVYDEVHLLQEQNKFRPDMIECVQFMARDFTSPIRLALTATSEVSQVHTLLQLACMPSNTSITRCSCNRSNCHIEIVPMLDSKTKSKETKFEHDSRDMFHRFNQVHRPQTIIFVTSKREAENLCNCLQVMCTENTAVHAHEISFFHAEVDKSARADRMKGFLHKAITVMVATTAFGTGVNYPNIRLVMHYTIPQTLVEYLQNIGRGGRDGEPYQCIMYYSYKNILECGGVWAQGAGFDSGYWPRYIEVVRYILSTKCRKAFILPYFDTSYQPGTVCANCDNCRLADVSMTIDIGRAASIFLQVVQEFASSTGILFSNVRDIITCGGLAAKRRSDGALQHPMRGIGARQGYTAANRHVWSLVCTYLLYSEDPLLKEEVTIANSTFMKGTITRSLMVTPAGLAYLASGTQKYTIRYPVELQHLPEASVNAMFSPHKKEQSPSQKVCSVADCESLRHAKCMCYKHYQASLRAAKRSNSAPASSKDVTDVPSKKQSDDFLSSAAASDADDDVSSFQPCTIASVSDLQRSPSCPHIPQTHAMLRPTAIRNPDGVTLSCSPPETQVIPLLASSPNISETSSDGSSSDEDTATCHSIEGQFYPGTLQCMYMAKPPVRGSTENSFLFEGNNPYASFNSYAKQQLRGSLAAASVTKRYKCLGVFLCSVSNCTFLYRPRIAAMRQQSLVVPKCGNVGLHGDNDVPMVHMKCPCVFQYHLDTSSNTTTLTVHNAPHTHPLPPPNKLAPSTMHEMSKSVRDGSQQSAFRFASQSQDEATMHPGRVRNAFKKFFQDTFGDDLGIGGLASLKQLTGGENWVRSAHPGGTCAGDFQMVFCQLDEQQELLKNVALAYENQEATTTAYIYTDVTYAYSDSYAQSYLTDSQVTGRGVVTAFCLMTRLTAEAYESSFLTLLTLNPHLWTIKDGNIELKFYVILDFADSQRKGIISAVKKLHESKCTLTPWTLQLEQTYMHHLKGCEFHYKQSVKNTSNNGSVVPYQKQGQFNAGCHLMLTAETMDDFK